MAYVSSGSTEPPALDLRGPALRPAVLCPGASYKHRLVREDD
jgi:hypothetical protein